jgi:diacylglycerol kinase (ATP)
MIDFKKLSFSFYCAFQGVKHALKHNQNLRIHFFVAALVIFASVIFHVNPFEMGILGTMILLVIAAEMINTAIEEMVDLITMEHRQEAKAAKDVAAGMVLIIALGSVIVGFLIFAPHIERLLR